MVLVKLLKKEYKRRSHLRPLLWDSTIQLPIEQVYTRLKIVSRGKLAIQIKKDDVNVFDIFKVPDIGEDVMTIVEGSPGIGKTTFCLKLAYDWAHGNIPSECSFPKFEFVFLLKCRDIDGDIMESISEQLLPRDMEKSVEKLLHLMKHIHNQERLMLIILDGLDELPEKSRHHVDELLERRILGFCYVLATTRQERGIEVRKSVVFDIHLEIKGYTESDSIAYIRRHFETIKQSPKGEKLIKEMQQNTFLHALRSNPLNLLLLCVVYEDYKGKLPTSRTELYQVIVRCLLRRYCGKRNWPAPKDDIVLEKTFEKEILALGELAWLCLLSDRYGFFETELDEFERKYPGLKARELDLLYMEESLKRLNPQHEYCFLHKTFQEYVAAAYIAQKLRNQKFNVFKHLNISFDDIVTKYPQVFIFVSGMLGEKATVLFTQIGEELKKTYDWNWNEHCSEEKATFFIESFNESRHAEQMAVTLCNIIPFPKVISLNRDEYNASFVEVLMACKSFSNLQTTVELYAFNLEKGVSGALNYIESCPLLTGVGFVHGNDFLTLSDADRLGKWFCATKILSEFTYDVRFYSFPEENALLAQIARGLASCRTLTKVTFALPGYAYSEDFFNALETGLTTLMSVSLELRGSMRYTATQALHNFLSSKLLNTLFLCIVGVEQDLLVAAVSEALTRQTVLKSLDLHFDGPLSSSSANFLEKGLMENSSLNYLRLCVLGELPGSWQSLTENLRSAKKPSFVCSIYPKTWNNVADNLCRPVVVRKGLNLKQHFTVNVWGEMRCEAAEALCEALALSSITFLTLNVHGNLTSEVVNSIARCLEGNQTLSVLSINIWGELTTEGGIVLSSLSKENLSVQLNKHDVRIGSDESNNVLDITMDNPAALKAFFTKVKDRRKEKVSLTINNNGYVTKEWTRCMGDALAENTSLTSLDLTVNSCTVDADLGEILGKCLLQSTSLTSLSVTFNFSNMSEGWLCNLGDSLDKMASLTLLSLDVNFYGEGKKGVLSTKPINVLVPIKSLSALSVVVHSDSVGSFWNDGVGGCLIECTSLKKLSLTFIVEYGPFHGLYNLGDGLAKTTSLDTLGVAIFANHYDANTVSKFFDFLNHGFSLNSSVNTLTVTVTVNKFFIVQFPSIFKEGLSVNKSVTTLSLTINECGEGESLIPLVLRHSGVFQYLVQNTSVTTFNLTLNSSKEVSDDWLPGLCDALKENTSLKTLRLKVTNHCTTGESRLYDFRKLVIESQTLALLELEVSFYGKDSGCQELLIQ